MATAVSIFDASTFQHWAGETLDSALVAAAPDSSEPARPRIADGGIIGRLEIPRLHLSVVVMDGDDDATLARAVGHVRGTALPWEPGNAVMAGHRDTFFRPLKNLRDGDEIRMTTPSGTFEYRVTSTEIVEPSDVSVMSPTPFRALTLVTCYPFVYIGNAPKRFIIHAR